MSAVWPFRDSTLFLVGNETIDTTQKFGLVMRGKLKPNGNRIWDTVAITQPYPAGNTTFDHGFGGIAISPAADSVYICSGSRVITAKKKITTDFIRVARSAAYFGDLSHSLHGQKFNPPADSAGWHLTCLQMDYEILSTSPLTRQVI
jgi:hypothetical protein